MINGQTAPIVRGGGFLYGPSGVAAPGGLLFLLSVHGICLAVFVTVQEDCAFINDYRAESCLATILAHEQSDKTDGKFYKEA